MTCKKTPLHSWHRAHGANMANFGGYDMPVWYPAGAKAEHLAVIQGAGLFDTSHMAAVSVRGENAFDLLQRAFTRDLAGGSGPGRKPLQTGRCAYGAFLDKRGFSLDDAIVYRLGETDFLVVVNAGMGGAIAEHLGRIAAEQSEPWTSVAITDLTDRVGKMDLQGPESGRVLARLLADPSKALEDLGYFSFRGHFDPGHPQASTVRLSDGTPVLLSRTGYTGEFGFELFMAPDQVAPIWDRILEAGAAEAILPCGLAARDSLRAGAVLPLSHQDIGHWPFHHHPWEFALPLAPDKLTFTKDFLGAEGLRAVTQPQFTKAFVGFDLRKVTPCDVPQVLDETGETIGVVLTCVTDMAIGRVDQVITSIASPDRPEGFKPRGLCCGFVKVDRDPAVGTLVTLKDRRRSIRVAITDDVRPHRTARRAIANMI